MALAGIVVAGVIGGVAALAVGAAGVLAARHVGSALGRTAEEMYVERRASSYPTYEEYQPATLMVTRTHHHSRHTSGRYHHHGDHRYHGRHHHRR